MQLDTGKEEIIQSYYGRKSKIKANHRNLGGGRHNRNFHSLVGGLLQSSHVLSEETSKGPEKELPVAPARAGNSKHCRKGTHPHPAPFSHGIKFLELCMRGGEGKCPCLQRALVLQILLKICCSCK